MLVLPPSLRGVPLAVRVLDMRGAVVARQLLPAAATAEVSLTLGALARGQYQCEVSAGAVRKTVRFQQQ